jgi:hypothetical protein
MSAVEKTRCRWVKSGDGETCVGEALDAAGQVLARVTISMEWSDGEHLRSVHGSEGLQHIEASAQDFARNLVENPPPK